MTYRELFEIETNTRRVQNANGFSIGITVISSYIQSDISNLRSSSTSIEYGNLEEFIDQLTVEDAVRLFQLGWKLTNKHDPKSATFFKYEL